MPEVPKKKPTENYRDHILLFVAAYTGNATKAAEAAGYTNPRQAGWRLMKDPEVQQALEAKQTRLVEAVVRRQADAISIGPVEAVNILGEIARSEKVSAAARVTAARTLAVDIYGMRITEQSVEALFATWTQEERETFARTREIPSRFRIQ